MDKGGTWSTFNLSVNSRAGGGLSFRKITHRERISALAFAVGTSSLKRRLAHAPWGSRNWLDPDGNGHLPKSVKQPR